MSEIINRPLQPTLHLCVAEKNAHYEYDCRLIHGRRHPLDYDCRLIHGRRHPLDYDCRPIHGRRRRHMVRRSGIGAAARPR
jgi:hypothetical protein